MRVKAGKNVLGKESVEGRLQGKEQTCGRGWNLIPFECNVKNLFPRKSQCTARILPTILHAKILNEENRRTVKALLLQFETISGCGKKRAKRHHFERQFLIGSRRNCKVYLQVFNAQAEFWFTSPRAFLWGKHFLRVWQKKSGTKCKRWERELNLYETTFRNDAVLRDLTWSISMCQSQSQTQCARVELSL